ncbi:MAG: dethiobiotin synthase [Planctomycetia bacterium]|nr:dethiobiotin synthase [Planctomycetia bacterium]
MNRNDSTTNGCIVIGTDTEVGKTYATGLILKELHAFGENCGYFKGAMSGVQFDAHGQVVASDAHEVISRANLTQSPQSACPYYFEPAVSPHLAARMRAIQIDMPTLRSAFEALCSRYDYVVAEGAGGLLCPMNLEGGARFFLVDMISQFGLPCVLVSHSGLGAINHVGLTAHYLRSRGIRLNALILNHYDANDPICRDNLTVCRELAQAPITLTLAQGQEDLGLSHAELTSIFARVG